MQDRKRFTLEQKYDVNPAYCDSFLKQTLWGFMTGCIMSGEQSMAEASRLYMSYFGIEDDVTVLCEIYRKMNKKMRTVVRNEEHLRLVEDIIEEHKNRK